MGRNDSHWKKTVRDIFRFGNQFYEEQEDDEDDQNIENDEQIEGGDGNVNDYDSISEQTRSVTDRGESPIPSMIIPSLSRETTKLLIDQNLKGTPNLDYVNSICRLYLVIHNIDELFLAHSSHTNTNSSCSKALSIIASCPVISIISSMSSLQSPLYLGWDHSTNCSYQWAYIHTPTTISQEPLPEVLSSVTSASNKVQRDRAVTLKYVLNSLTRKHLDIIKYLLTNNFQNDSTDLTNSTIGNNSTVASSSSSSSQGVR